MADWEFSFIGDKFKKVAGFGGQTQDFWVLGSTLEFSGGF